MNIFSKVKIYGFSLTEMEHQLGSEEEPRLSGIRDRFKQRIEKHCNEY
jgi:hypothetical protein